MQQPRKKIETVIIFTHTFVSQIKKIVLNNNFQIVKNNPDFIICYGGDGTILFAERKYPQVPKLIIKKSRISRKYDYTLSVINNLLRNIRIGKYRITREMKLEAQGKKARLIGLNEIQIRATRPINALRFSVTVNGNEFHKLIGDGIVIATPFGSTGYYKSTGGKQFKKGIGISFNNLHNRKLESFVVSERSTINVKVLRGPAWIIADNNEKFLDLRTKDITTVNKSEDTANFICVP